MADLRRSRFEAEALTCLDELFRVARRVTGDTAVAEDLVQETYLQAWKGFDRFEPGTNCRAWLYKILFRAIAGRRRDLQRDLAMFDDVSPDESRLGAPVVATPLAAQQIRQAFEALPLAFATVVHLVDVEGLTYKEASGVLDVPVGTVMSRLHRGRRQLRQLLAPGPTLVKQIRERS